MQAFIRNIILCDDGVEKELQNKFKQRRNRVIEIINR
jgi:hypothetical protein